MGQTFFCVNFTKIFFLFMGQTFLGRISQKYFLSFTNFSIFLIYIILFHRSSFIFFFFKNSPLPKWAMPKKTTTKQAKPKWSRHKVVYPICFLFNQMQQKKSK